MSETRYVIESDGRIFRVTTTKTQVEVLAAVAKEFQHQVVCKIPGLMDFDNPFFGKAGMVMDSSGSNMVWSVRVKTLNLNTNFAVASGKFLFPDFAGQESGTTKMQMQWKVPDNINLVLGMIVLPVLTGGFQLSKHYLVAFDGHHRMWKLPLSNLYDHCELCHGQNTDVHYSILKAVQVGMEGFRVSEWNGDLYHSHPATSGMFGFEPVNDGFVQRPVPSNWTDFCSKVSNEFLNTYILP